VQSVTASGTSANSDESSTTTESGTMWVPNLMVLDGPHMWDATLLTGSDGDRKTLLYDLLGVTPVDFTSSFGAPGAILKTNIINSLPILRFAGGGSDWFYGYAQDRSAGQPLTVAYLAKNSGIGDGVVIGSSGGAVYYMTLDLTGISRFLAETGPQSESPAPSDPTDWQLYLVRRSGGTVTMRNWGSPLSISGSTGSAGRWIIEQLCKYSNSAFDFKGDLVMAMCGDSALSDSDCEKFEGYWAWKVGKQTRLPIDHPYRNDPPATDTDLLPTSNFPADNSNNKAFVLASPLSSADKTIIFLARNLDVTNGSVILGRTDTTSQNLYLYPDGKCTLYSTGTITTSTTPADGTVDHLYSITHQTSSGNIAAYRYWGSSAGSVSQPVAFTPSHIGAYIDVSYAMTGKIGMIVVSDAVESSGDIEKAEGYIAHRVGMEDRLPVDHPYKVAPPVDWDLSDLPNITNLWDFTSIVETNTSIITTVTDSISGNTATQIGSLTIVNANYYKITT
jgi:hypothetical protein